MAITFDSFKQNNTPTPNAATKTVVPQTSTPTVSTPVLNSATQSRKDERNEQAAVIGAKAPISTPVLNSTNISSTITSAASNAAAKKQTDTKAANSIVQLTAPAQESSSSASKSLSNWVKEQDDEVADYGTGEFKRKYRSQEYADEQAKKAQKNAALQMNIALANDDYDTISRLRKENNLLDDNEQVSYLARRTAGGLLGAVEGIGNFAGMMFSGEAPEDYDYDNPVMTSAQFRESISDYQPKLNFAQNFEADTAKKLEGKSVSQALKVAGDVTSGVSGMVPSIAANLVLPGSSLPVLFTQAAGNASSEAVRNGAHPADALGYGLAVGAVEVLTEKMFDGVANIYGKGAADDMMQSVAAKVSADPNVQKAFVKTMDILGEGFEEFVSEFADYGIDKVTVRQDDRRFVDVMGDAGYSFLVGALTSAVMEVSQSGRDMSPKQMADEVKAKVAETVHEEAQKTSLDNAIMQTLTEKALGINENQTDNRTTQQNLPQNPTSQAQSVITAPQTIAENTQENTARNAAQTQTVPQTETEQIQPQTAQPQNQSSENAQLLDDVDTAIEQIQNEIEQTKWALEWSDDTERAAHTKRLAQLNSQLNALEETRQNIVNRGNTQTEQSLQIPQTARNDAPGAKQADFQSEPKQSQTQWNTIGAIESQNDVPADVQEPIFYDTISEQQSMANARARLEQDYAGEMSQLRSKTNWKGEEVDMGMTILDNYRREAEATGDWSKYEEWRKVVSAHGTAAGQALQAYAKYSRQTGGGLVAEATAALDNAKKGTDKNKVMNEVNNLAQEYDAAREGANGDTDIDGLLNVIRKASEIRKTSSAKNGKIKGLEWAIERVANLARAEVESGENGDYVEFIRAFAANSIYNIAADTNSTTVGEALKTLRRQAMLSKVSTTMRNLVSNNVFDPVDSVSRNMSVPLDMLLSKITGTRSVAADASWLSKAKRTGSLNGLARACMEVGLDVSVSAEGKYENTANRTFKMSGGIFSKIMSTWEAIEGYALNATDEFQKGGIEASVQEGIDRLYEQGKITKRDSRTKKTVKRIVDNSLQNAGEQEALYRTFQDDTAISKIATKGRSVLNEAGRAAAERLGFNPSEDGLGVGDVILPFAQVPSNLAARAIEYSPAGLIKSTVSLVNVLKAAKQGTLTAAQQAQAVQGIGRGINGTAMIAIAAAGALRGWMNVAGDDDDKNKAGMEKGQGLTGTQLNLDAALRDIKGEGAEWRDGDTLLSIGFLDPMNAQLTTGALLADDIKEAEGETLKDRLGSVGFGRIFGDSLSGAIQSVLDTPMMSQFASIADSIKYSKAETAAGKAVDAAKQFAAGIPSSFIPNALTGIAQGTDSVERNAYSSDSIGQQTIDSIKASIPGLRQTLPAKQDSWGNDVTNEGGIQNFLNRNINPGTVTKYKTNEIETELERISEATGESLFPQKSAPYSVSFTKDGEKQNVKLDYEQRTAYQKAYGDAYADAVSDLLGSKNYNDMPDEMKAEILNKAENIATNKAKDSLGIGFTMSDDDRAVYDAGAKEKVDSLIVSAIGSKKYLSDDLKSGYDNAKTAISSIDGLPEDVRKAASDKAMNYYLDVEKSKYGGEMSAEHSKLLDKSSEEIAAFYAAKAIKDAGYVSSQQKEAYNAVSREIDNIGGNYGKAKEYAADYYAALEASKLGVALSDDYAKLEGLTDEQLAGYFVNKAVKKDYIDLNNSGSSWDEILTGYNSGDIPDKTVFWILPEKEAESYTKWGKDAGVTAEQWLDALSYYNSEACKDEKNKYGKTVVSKEDKFNSYLLGNRSLTDEQRKAISYGFYHGDEYKAANYEYLSDAVRSGIMSVEEAERELPGGNASEHWAEIAKPAGIKLADYMDFVSFCDQTKDWKTQNGKNYSYKYLWVCDELNKRTDLTKEQKYALAIAQNMGDDYKDSTKGKIYNALK